MELFIGIDIGGTGVKGLLCDEQGAILQRASVPTEVKKGNLAVCDNVAILVNELLKEHNRASVVGVGVGCPGLIDSENGKVVFAGNLNMRDFALADEIAKRIQLPVKITNDANAAALGEAKFGAGKNYDDSILVTLGTGVGGGIILGGKLFEGFRSAGAEIGHMVIDKHGEFCSCGRRGCFECYSSATALVRRTCKVMMENLDSAMWNTYNTDTCSGKTAFDYCDTDQAAREVVDWYLHNLCVGLANLANIFRPQVIMLGGGVSAQGERITAPLQRMVNDEIFAGNDYAPVKITTASLGNDAGGYGAAALFMRR